jgi:hypothetical protein
MKNRPIILPKINPAIQPLPSMKKRVLSGTQQERLSLRQSGMTLNMWQMVSSKLNWAKNIF